MLPSAGCGGYQQPPLITGPSDLTQVNGNGEQQGCNFMITRHVLLCYSLFLCLHWLLKIIIIAFTNLHPHSDYFLDALCSLPVDPSNDIFTVPLEFAASILSLNITNKWVGSCLYSGGPMFKFQEDTSFRNMGFSWSSLVHPGTCRSST